MSNKVKIRLFGVLCIIFLCVAGTIKSFQNDTFYIIKIGEYIVNNGIDKIDHYSWISNLPYSYPHWLYDVFMYYVYNSFGYYGVYVSVIFYYIVFVLLFYFICLKMTKNEFLSLFSSIISLFSICSFMTARSQSISIIIFFLEVYFINRLIKSNKNRYLIILVLLSCFLANIHGTAWLMYFVLFLPFFGEYIVYYFSNNKKLKKLFKIRRNNKSRLVILGINNIKKLFICFILCFVVGLITPNHICYSYVFRVMLGDSQAYIVEHFPMVLVKQSLFLIIIIVLIIVLTFSNVKLYLNKVFMILGIIIMCLFSVRHLVFFYSIGLLYISVFLNRYFIAKNDFTLDILYSKLVNNKVLLLLLVIVLGCSYIKFNKNFSVNYISKSEYPIDATNYIKENLDYKDIKLYNHYNYGSYLLFNDVPVFVDSRCDLYLKEFNGHDDIFDDAMEIYDDYEKKFKYYDVDYALVNKKELLYKLLRLDGNYKRIYSDKYFALFRRLGDV